MTTILSSLSGGLSRRSFVAAAGGASLAAFAGVGRAAAAAAATAMDEDDEVSASIDELDLEEDIEEDLEEAETPDGVKCPSCGHSNPAQNPFCEECGAALAGEDEDFADDFDLIDDDELDL